MEQTPTVAETPVKLDGRRKPGYGEQGYIKCECTLLTKEERKNRCTKRQPPQYGSDTCLYYLEGGYCWLEIPTER
jgi:hypothetical protein